jgi:hypothetical protein
MRALETFVIYVTPFLIIGIAARLLMKRKGVDLSDVQAQAGSNRRARKVFLLGAWRKLPSCGLFHTKPSLRCRPLAPNGPAAVSLACPLSGHERTNRGRSPRSQFDPLRKSGRLRRGCNDDALNVILESKRSIRFVAANETREQPETAVVDTTECNSELLSTAYGNCSSIITSDLIFPSHRSWLGSFQRARGSSTPRISVSVSCWPRTTLLDCRFAS